MTCSSYYGSSSEPVGVDGGSPIRSLTHFFSGAQSKEETASAYLATLLDSDPEFRVRFLDLADVEPRLDGSLEWAVRVEDSRVNTGTVDVTLEWPPGDPTTFVMVENKVSASAKTDGQFRKYYRGAVAAWPGAGSSGCTSLRPQGSRSARSGRSGPPRSTSPGAAGTRTRTRSSLSTGRTMWPPSSAGSRAQPTGLARHRRGSERHQAPSPARRAARRHPQDR